MKNIFLIGLLLGVGSLSFSRGISSRNCGGQNYINSSPQLQKSEIKIEEKQLKIKKEMTKTKPNWNKIEKLNKEISAEHAKNKTTSQRIRHSVK